MTDFQTRRWTGLRRVHTTFISFKRLTLPNFFPKIKIIQLVLKSENYLIDNSETSSININIHINI